jgi:hypothetical protein
MNSDLPIACTLTPDQLRQGRDALLPGIMARAERLDRLADGVRCHFIAVGGLIPAIATMIEAERQCCRFLRFTLTAESGEGTLILDVTGPPGTVDFLAGWIREA